MPKTGRAKSIPPATNKDKKSLLNIRARDVVTRVGISATSGRSKSRVQPTRLQEPLITNFSMACEMILFRLATNFGFRQFLVIMLTPFKPQAKTLFLVRIRIVFLQVFLRLVK